MKSKLIYTLLAIFVCAMLAATPSAAFQEQKDKPAPISDGEKQAVQKINTAVGAAEKLKLAGEYLKKYGKSTLRPKIADHVSIEIGRVADFGQRLSLIENYNKIFNLPNEVDLVKPIQIEALINTGKFDDAINEANKYLEKNPGDVPVLTQLAWAGVMQAQAKTATPKLLQAATKAANQAVELMEADKRPDRMDEKMWSDYRNSWLPKLYQAQGVILLSTNDKAGAKEKLEKAMGFDPYDPPTLMMLVNIVNEEYQDLAKRYQTEKKSELMTKAVEKMDEAIDLLARAVAATEGNAQFGQLSGSLMENLKSYYEFRNNGKTDGMKALVEKYKKK